ncbi:MAG: FMN-binding protein [Fibrobacteria bacterium]|nr:FMN-binding protein [Fibrobacteria bacterium]
MEISWLLRKGCASFLLLILLFQITSGSEIKEKSESFITNTFNGDAALEFRKLAIPTQLKSVIQKQVKQKFFRDDVYFWIVKNNNKIIGYALLDNVMGKALPITFLVVLDTSLSIRAVSIIKYRETIGGEIANKNWTAQFVNKNATSGFLLGRDIDGISGATMSVVSVSKGVEKLVLLLSKIKDSL